MYSKRWMMRIGVSLMLFFLVAGCAPTVTPMPLPTLPAFQTPTPNEAGMIIYGPEEAMRVDAEAYAKSYGVSVEEAIQRLQYQEGIGELNAALQANEAVTFGGLWIEHEPEFQVVVLFTHGGKTTIHPYLKGKAFADLVEVRKSRYSLAELEKIYEQTVQELAKLDFGVNTYLDVQGNRVKITVSDRKWFESELRKAGAKLPKGAEVIVVAGGTTAKDKELLLTPPVPGIAFPRQKPSEGPSICMAALMIGTLRLENGCLYVQPLGGGSSVVPVWQPSYSLRVEGDEVLVIGGNGEVAARVGEEVNMGGGMGSADEWITQQLPAACQGRYWITCGVRPNLKKDSELFALDVITDTQRTVLFLRTRETLDRQVVEPTSISGKLVTYNYRRCLQVETRMGSSYTLFWPMEWSASLEDGKAIVLDGSGKVVAREGEEIKLRGRDIPQSGDDTVYWKLINEMPGDCTGASRVVDGGE